MALGIGALLGGASSGTRDHSFDPTRIAGLTENEQAKLHAAAHYGY